jgi:hypothetical protein
VVDASFDGYPTFLGGLASLIAFVTVALLTEREAPIEFGPVAEAEEAEKGLAPA